MSKERIENRKEHRDSSASEINVEVEDYDGNDEGSGYGGVIGLEADEDIFYYRWGKYNVGLIGNVDVVREIMEVLSNAQKQS